MSNGHPGMDLNEIEVFGSPSGRSKRQGAHSKKRKKAQAPQGDENGNIVRKAQLRLPMLRGIMAPDISHQERATKQAGTANQNQSGHDFEEQLQLVTGEDAITFFARHGNNTPVKFVYCNRQDTGDEFRPYDLVIADRKKLDPEFFTISSAGVVHVSPNQPSEFVSLADWMHQSTIFNVLRSIRFFKHYLIAKMFRMWRSNVRYRLYCKQRKQLSRSLFLARPSFCTPLIEVNKLMVEMDGIKLISWNKSSVFESDAFESEQTSQRSTANKKFEAVTDKLEACVEKVCKGVKERARAYDHGVASDDLSNSRFAQHLMGGNGRSKSMVAIKKERAERVRRLQHAAFEANMLGAFIRLVDYMEVEHLISITTSSTAEFLKQGLLTRRGALFLTKVKFGDERLEFKPTVNDIHKITAQTLAQMVQTVDTVERILKTGKTTITLQEQPKVGDAITDDRGFGLTKKAISQKIDEDFTQIEKTISFLEKHRPVYEFGKGWDIEEYKLHDHTVQSIQQDMKQQKEWEHEIDRIRMSYDAGIFQAETKGLKNALLPVTKTALSDMKELLLSFFSDSCSELQHLYTEKIRSIDEDPQHLHLYAKHVELFNKVKDEGAELAERAQKVEIMHKLLVDHKMKIPSNDKVAFDDLLETVKLFDEQITKTEINIDEKKKGMKDTVIKNIIKITKDLNQQKELLQEGIFIDEKAQPGKVLKALAEVKNTLDEITTQTTTMQGYQVLFGVDPPHPFHNLPETVAVYDKKLNFWNLHQTWLEKTRTWKDADFLTLNVEEMNNEVREYTMAIHKINKEENDSAVTRKVKEQIGEWKNVMPMVVDLGNPAMQQQHWRVLFSSLGHTFYATDKIRLRKLRSLNIFNHKQLISDIVEQAVGEYSLRVSLEKVQQNWQDQCFILAEYTRLKDVSILGDVEEVMASLEDNQVSLQTMLASRYIATIQSEVEVWDKKLANLSEIIDEWLTCQRNWMYLEPIFSAADIQRQLPMEAKMFLEVDKFWKDLMRRVTNNPNVMAAIAPPTLLQQFIKANADLDKIQKHLEEYLETKRSGFPRFYFLSNDELLQILSQSRDPQAVQPHLRKCFDNMAKIHFTDAPNSVEVTGMISGEGEHVDFVKPVFTTGNVETWLTEIEIRMQQTMRSCNKACLEDYPTNGLERTEWLFKWPVQPVLCIDMIMWTKNAHEALENIENGSNPNAMKDFMVFSRKQINGMVEVVRGNLSKIQRMLMSSLIILDVHNRDVVQTMVDVDCSSLNDFEWAKQLRYYWETDFKMKGDAVNPPVPEPAEDADPKKLHIWEIPDWEECQIKQTTSVLPYKNEYLGAPSRLVITPLTDKCFLTLTGALHLYYGGAPAGPAGTGKTESVKDLAKALAVQIVVFNCSDGLNAKMMGRFFSGLAQAGAWACFDEFNRIDIEVLSVIAQQILTIQHAIANHKSPFEFEGHLIPLKPSFGVFITMNPGYAGRTELPDNLKSLFRPVAMMVPDYALIAQIILFSEGFMTATPLSKKMVQLYKLASEQLSKQDHYDFGMRAVKSVLVMAGALKRRDPDLAEDVVLIRAMRDSNVPKFLEHDLPLFRGIISDLFPGVAVPFDDYGLLEKQIIEEIEKKNYVAVPSFVTKVIQFHETTIVRHGVMLVGTTMTGKSTCSDILGAALTSLAAKGVEGVNFNKTDQFRLNPKSITMGELYGMINPVSYEWTEGIVALLVREASADTSDARKWVIFDGPVDALWIENMNTVLDDNKVLCLANGERIKLASTVNMVFECEDLSVASPATVSRCGMVYLEPVHVGWKPLIDTWQKSSLESWAPNKAEFICTFLKDNIGSILTYVKDHCSQKVQSVDSNMVTSCIRFFEDQLKPLVRNKHGDAIPMDEKDFNELVHMQLFLAIVWSFGANLVDENCEPFSTFIREQCGKLVPNLPADGSVYDYCVDRDALKFATWTSKVADFVYDVKQPFFNILVPTADTTKYKWLIDTNLSNNHNVMFMGDTGVGKTVVLQDYIFNGAEGAKENNYVPILVMFSAQTTSTNLQDAVETKLEKKRKNLFGAPVGKTMVLFVDDVNMPTKEEYGAQPPIELFRQMIDSGGFYDRKKLFFKYVKDTVFVTACAAPGGGRNSITGRLSRHFHMVWQPLLAEESMKRIFKGILRGFLSHTCDHFETDVVELASSIIDSSVSIYKEVIKTMLPTPKKSHYTFNLRDLGKVVQGMCCIEKKFVPDVDTVLKLWVHEASRTFRDRLIDDEDRVAFDGLLTSQLRENLNSEVVVSNSLMFGDYLTQEDKFYQLVPDLDKLGDLLLEYLDEYNMMAPSPMHLVFFKDAVMHLSRISRILRQPRGNALLVGVGGSGRQSLTRLAAHMAGYKCSSIEITRNYGKDEWHDNIKDLLKTAGADNQPIVFLFTDSMVVEESFLEDINNLLNSGEVPNLFEADEIEEIVGKVRPLVKAAGKIDTRDNIISHFIQLCRENLHIVLAFSPVGDAFRARCRQYPSMVNCCTIDWFDAWPEDALFAVATAKLAEKEEELGFADIRESLCKICVNIHSSVAAYTKTYFAELRRINYVTPTSYLELISMYTGMLQAQKDAVNVNLTRYTIGLQKLRETNTLVEELRESLIELQPVLKKSSEETAALLIDLEKDQKVASEAAAVCSKDAAETQQVAKEVGAIKDDCQRDLDEALPAFESAVKALDTLKKDDITMLKSFNNPPALVKLVMDAVCLLFGKKQDWKEAKLLLSNQKFLENCRTFDKDNIPPKTIKNLQVFISNPDFQPDKLASVSSAAVSLCMWARAMDVYARVAKSIVPKKAKLAEAEAELQAAEEKLASKQADLRQVEQRVAALQAKFQAKMAEKEDLENRMVQTKARLGRAEQLVSGLGSEEGRWDTSAKTLSADLVNVYGNVLLAAGFISYIGPFTAGFRNNLVVDWTKFTIGVGVNVDPEFNFVRILSDPLQVRKWNLQGLPADNFSIENGMLVTKGRRWPLCIDPQGQANRWVKNFGKKDNLQVVKLSEPNYLRVLENAIRYGQPVLMENVEEKLDAAIEPVLMKQVFKQGGQWVLKLGDQDVPYSQEFKFFITTKLPNPHYLPETFVKVTVINFTVTLKGLEDQLLVVVCALERPDLEEKNDQLVVSIADDKAQLSEIEAQILKMLSESQGNILDDQDLIDALGQSKTTSTAVNARMAEAEATVKIIEEVREKYRVVSRRASILYFVIADLAKIDPMYQYSLVYFTNIYKNRIQNSEQSSDLPTRLNILLDDILLSFYENICQGLFEAHKLVFSFMMAIQIGKGDGSVSAAEWSHFVRGPEASNKPPQKNPTRWLSDEQWKALTGAPASFIDIADDLKTDRSAEWEEWFNSFTSETPSGKPLPCGWEEKLSIFQRLLVLQTFKPEKLTPGIKTYVSGQIGASFVKPPPFDLTKVYNQSDCRTPIVFVLSPGADPMAYLMKLATEQGKIDEQFRYISLGQGQGPIAEELMENARREGGWVCLQNCHLSISWLPTLERVLETTAGEDIHPEYRLWLTSMPTPKFPVPILQGAAKLTNEPPKGLSSNLMRTFLDIEESDYEDCKQLPEFKKLIFGLAFFHAVILERRKFGPVGWNIPYEWMNSDLVVCIRQLRIYLNTNDSVPWQTLREIIGEVNYAGRVTDDKDQRCIGSLLSTYFNPGILLDDYRFTTSDDWYAPSFGTLQESREFISNLPEENPEAFGLHANADITFQLKESKEIIDTLVMIEPRSSGDASGKTPDEIAAEMAAEFLQRLPEALNTAAAHPDTFAGMDAGNTLGVFLAQEVSRFNVLLVKMKKSLVELQKALKGLVVMSAELEAMFNAFLFNQVPTMWEAAAYPSLKPLASWFTDLIERLTFMDNWIRNSNPTCYWISGFFFPQGFMTSVLQKYARKTKIPIDTLKFETEVQSVSKEDAVPVTKGALIYGLHLQGAGWDRPNCLLVESNPGELFLEMPIIWLKPVGIDEPFPEGAYNCPVYKTSTRAGTLSTTGHSTNFVLYLQLGSKKASDHWIRRGVALLCMLDT
mmetsp:Transcript_44767/g.87731  ORF Transcript_44767/g.87731 Transcript_44767/m.87731 type:complete len:3997 (-) Transcript_44767:184-12174(-)|eukprot:CAMPEP_0175168536 /NCGR_PEP_ID=MMETSP0087-20121206/29009_1 /TAXON_ID=136419 /ORGANISM="Unknown Unknown, Strain D1" /LENGTH=3996 /DNA_ID=CAMNT_0016458661 /DNA_START=44 /DNA_END=12034 /DNA_ORIENTATION=+